MAIGWLTVLRSVPWADVIGDAPILANGAKKLWRTINKPTVPEAGSPVKPPRSSAETQTIATLQMQLAALEASIADLNDRMLVSSELIKTLADQNALLIKCVDANRIRMLWLTGAVAIIVLSGLALMFI